jgi:hypothetical protein
MSASLNTPVRAGQTQPHSMTQHSSQRERQKEKKTRKPRVDDDTGTDPVVESTAQGALGRHVDGRLGGVLATHGNGEGESDSTREEDSVCRLGLACARGLDMRQTVGITGCVLMMIDVDIDVDVDDDDDVDDDS